MNSRFSLMTIDEVTLNRPKIVTGFSVIGSASWESSGSPWSSPLRSSLPTGCSRLRVGSRNSWTLKDNFAVPSAVKKICGVNTAFALSLGAWISDASMFSSSSMSATGCLLSKFHTRSIRIRGIFQVKLSCRTGGILIGLWQKSGGILPWSHTEWLVLGMVRRIVFHQVFSHLPGSLQHFTNSRSIPLNQPTTFRPSQITTVQQTYLLLLIGRLFQRCHLSRIDEVLTCGDSMTKPHMLSQIPSSCTFSQLLVLATVPKSLISFFRLMCRFCFTRIRLNPLSGEIL